MATETIGELPRRPRTKLATPVTAGLAAIILAAAGFVGGVQVQKGQATTATASPARAFPSGGGPPAAAGDATTGTVSYVKGDTLYVKEADGSTVEVKASDAKVSRTASGDAGQVQPGDSVVVQGQADAKGTVTASAVTATER
jgi:hypothetical protein